MIPNANPGATQASSGSTRIFAKRSARRAPGFVLLIVLVVIAVLSLAAYTFSELMISHQDAAKLSSRQLQARTLVESGAEYTRSMLMQSRQARMDNGGVYDNATVFQRLVVMDEVDPNDQGAFSIVAANMDSSGVLEGTRYGLEDESSRLNLNSLLIADKVQGGGRQILMSLPGMTEDVADAILDWLDEDDEPREFGAEYDYYSGVDPPYAPKNGPFQTVEELLLVRGVTPAMLFGRDVNRNGMVDPHEVNMPLPDGMDNGDGSLDRGWSAYLTLFSMEKNVNSSGQPRINLNQDDLEQLHSQLSSVFSQEWANFIVLYRQNGPASGGGTSGAVAGPGGSGGSSMSGGTAGNTTTGGPPGSMGTQGGSSRGGPSSTPTSSGASAGRSGSTPPSSSGTSSGRGGSSSGGGSNTASQGAGGNSGAGGSTGSSGRGGSSGSAPPNNTGGTGAGGPASGSSGRGSTGTNPPSNASGNGFGNSNSSNNSNSNNSGNNRNPGSTNPNQAAGQAGSLTTTTAAGVTMDFTKPAKTQLTQLLDLIGANVQVTPPGQTQPVIVTSPFTSDPLAMGVYMPALMENCASSGNTTIPGRININQAPRQLLMGIPGIREEVVNEIISRRDTEPDGQNPNRKYETWIMTEMIVTKEEMQQLLPFVCAGGDVYRAQIVGYFPDGSASSRAEVIFDATQAVPRILRWRDMSHLGRGYALETLGVGLQNY